MDRRALTTEEKPRAGARGRFRSPVRNPGEAVVDRLAGRRWRSRRTGPIAGNELARHGGSDRSAAADELPGQRFPLRIGEFSGFPFLVLGFWLEGRRAAAGALAGKHPARIFRRQRADLVEFLHVAGVEFQGDGGEIVVELLDASSRR